MAAQLYDETAALLAADIYKGAASPASHAVGVLRDIGDACALASGQWPLVERDWADIPSRAVIELAIRLYEIDNWAASFGLDVCLTSDPDSVPEEAFGRLGPPPELTRADFAAQLGVVVEGYDRVRSLLNDSSTSTLVRKSEFRSAVRADISSGRGWVVWGRGHLESDVFPAAALPLYVAQGVFVAITTDADARDLFPSEGFVSDLLSADPVRQLLEESNVKLPAWASN